MTGPGPTLSRVLRRDLRLALRQWGDAAMIPAFFVIAASLFPLGLGASAETLARIAPAVLWVIALLAAMLSLDRLFLTDYEDGSLELIALDPNPLALAVLGKCAAHWLTTGLPLTLLAPVLALLLNLDPAAIPALVLAMALATPSLTLIGAIGAALTLGARRGGVLLSLLVLPLYVPILSFGAGAVDAAVHGEAASPYIVFLGAVLLGALSLAPWATAAAVRQAVE
ncbi:MAG: heme exporter protein CcmB [Alphaproteobacteria bacterium]|nr:heme exporter protein CcmB [Alphaproteobacteria bacterium]